MTQQWGWQPLAWEQNGLPSWTWRSAPAGLVTRRQMRTAGFAPGGAEPVGQIVYRRGRREVRALLWDRTDLVPKRVPSAAQREALGKAMAARRWCPTCEQDAGYCVPTSLGMCVDCAYPDTAWPVDEAEQLTRFHDHGQVAEDRLCRGVIV
jgi:hypothetical protein